MSSLSRAHFFKWAVIGGIAAVGVAGLNIAIGQGGNAPLRPATDGWSFKADYDPKDWPTMNFSLTIANTEEKKRTLERTIKLVRQEFKGNPLSRTLRPGDIETKELESQDIKVTVPGHGSKTLRLEFKTKAAAPASSEARPPRVSYLLMTETNGRPFPIGGARQPAK